MLHSLIEAAGLEGHRWLDDPLERGLAFAAGFLLLDTLICKGPLKGRLLAAFSQGGGSAEARRRFLSQLAAKLVGMLFLTSVMPLAFKCLVDPALHEGARFVDQTPTSQRMVEVGCGYFLYDIVICAFKFGDNGWEFALHAVVCSFVFTVSTVRGIMQYYGAAFLMWELSTPFMYLRWFMLKAGLGDSPAMALVNAAFMLVFFGCRNVWGPIATLEFWRESGAQLGVPGAVLSAGAIWTIRVMASALNCLNAYWFATMIRIAFFGGGKVPKNKPV